MNTHGSTAQPVCVKLGIHEGTVVHVVNPPANYHEVLSPLPLEVSIKPGMPESRSLFIHYFTSRLHALKTGIVSLVDVLDPQGAIWISWPKKHGALARDLGTDLNEETIREVCLALGLVNTKSCALNDNWSALKFVWRYDRR